MRLRALFALLLVLLVISLSARFESAPIQAQQEDNSSPYRVAFALQGEVVRVGYPVQDDTWRTLSLPARGLFQAQDFGIARPFWTPDGNSFYITTYLPNSEDIANTVQRYDFPSDTLTRVLSLPTPEEGRELVRIESLSPDSRYALLVWATTSRTALADLETGNMIVPELPCPAQVLNWQPDEVLLGCSTLQFNQPSLFTVELPGGDEGRLLLPPSDELQTAGFIETAFRLPDGRVLLGSTDFEIPAPIGVITWEEYGGQYFGTGTDLHLTAEAGYAAFLQEGRLVRVRLSDLSQSDLGAADYVTSESVGDGLIFWQATTLSNSDFQLARVTATPLSRYEQVIYRGAPPQRWDASPYGTYAALEFRRSDGGVYIEVYNQETLLWVSDAEYPGSYAQLHLEAERPLAWSPDGAWLHLRFNPTPQEVQQTLSLDLSTGRTVRAPDPTANLVSQSPDGAWWLYLVVDDAFTFSGQRLLAYRPETERVFIVSEDLPLVTGFPVWQYFVWSPLPPTVE